MINCFLFSFLTHVFMDENVDGEGGIEVGNQEGLSLKSFSQETEAHGQQRRQDGCQEALALKSQVQEARLILEPNSPIFFLYE